MPRGRHKAVVFVLILIFLLVQPLILASIPRDAGGSTTAFVVKKGTKLAAIAGCLEKDDLVNSRYLFLLCSVLLHRGRVVAGEYELSTGMSILEIARKMANGERKVYTLKIVEGYNLYTLSEVIERAGIMEGKAFLRLVADPAVLSGLGIPAGSCEGYFWPDTYFYSKEISVEEFLERITQRTVKFFEREEIKKRMQEIGMSAFQVISFASIIEKEARLEDEKPLISAVFHNRLRLGMSLDADPTVIYGLASFNRSLTKADLATETPYNTYRMRGLPKGPICDPSKSSILAVLYPAGSDALYFVSKNDGSHVFSRTIQEHNRFVTAYQRHKIRNHN